MEFMKKRELLVFPDSIRFLRQGYSLCTMFKKEDKGYGFIYVKELFNLVYCPSLGKFCYNKHVRLPLGVCQSQGYSLCTMFKKEDKGYGFIYVKELFNLVYCPSLGKFCYNKHVRLPLGVCQNFIGMRYTEQSKSEMEKLRIYDMAEAIEVAQANKEEIEHSKEKILRF